MAPQPPAAQHLANSASVCPQCLTRIPAQLMQQEHTVTMVKTCPHHGRFESVVWQGPPAYTSWTRPKTPLQGGRRHKATAQGCPLDCGLCPQHRQRSCTVLVEVTGRCNLHCPVCFADSGHDHLEPSLDELRKQFAWIFANTGGCNLQISGGEPTLRQDLVDIVKAARDSGFTFVQLNTNGLRFAEDPNLAHRLQEAGLSSVFLQFDGLDAATWEHLRGRDLRGPKEEALVRLTAAGLGVVLVATVVRGINDQQLWRLCRYALDRMPGVRGLHLQPVSLFGRFPQAWQANHLTLPELMQGLSQQSSGRIDLADFAPPGCEHALCSFSARYLEDDTGRLVRLGGTSCDCSPQPAESGALHAIDATARQWAAASPLPIAEPASDAFSRFLERARTHTFSLSAMAFQDCWTLDLERLQGCCIHVASDNRLIPFCAYNLTGLDGQSLYRSRP